MAIRPQASVQPTAASPRRVTDERLVCHGVEAVRPRAVASSSESPVAAPTGSSRSPASSTVAAMVPAAPPTCTGRTSADATSYESRTPVSQPAALSPNVVGTACWVRVRATIGVRRWSSTRSTRRRTCSRRAVTTTPNASRAQSIRAVSTTSWLVSPRCSQRVAVGTDVGQRAAEHLDEGGRGVAAGFRPLGDELEVVGADEALEVELGDAGRRDAGAGEGVEPGLLDGHHRREEGLVGAQVAGTLVAGPQEVGHRLSLAWPRTRGTPSLPHLDHHPDHPLALQPDVEDEAVLVGRRDEGGAPVGVERGEQLVVGVPGQVRAGEEAVEQAAGEHGEREERRSRASPW